MLIWSFWPAREGGSERQCRKLVEKITKDSEIEFLVLTSWFTFSVPHEQIFPGWQIIRLGVLAPLENHARSLLEGLLNRIFVNYLRGETIERWSRITMFWLMLPLVWCSRLSFIIFLQNWFSHHYKNVDIIHVHDSGWLAGVGAWIGSRYNIQVMAKTATSTSLPHISYDTPLRWKWDIWRRRCYFIAQNEFLAEGLIDKGIPKDRISVISNGVELPDTLANPYLPGPVLYVGNFSQGAYWKAFDILLKAWAKVHQSESEAKLYMLGGGETTLWKKYAFELNCENSIRFLGWVKDPSPFYKRSCLFVLASRVEGISNALLEAQSWGLPCIVSNIPGNLAVVKDGVNGLVVPVGDDEKLSEAIIRLLKDPDLRRQLGQAAHKKAKKKFNMPFVQQQFLGVYRKLMVS